MNSLSRMKKLQLTIMERCGVISVHAISYMPEEMKRYDLHIDNKAYNMGIFGGTDIDFIQRYTYKAFDFNIKERLKRQKIAK